MYLSDQTNSLNAEISFLVVTEATETENFEANGLVGLGPEHVAMHKNSNSERTPHHFVWQLFKDGLINKPAFALKLTSVSSTEKSQMHIGGWDTDLLAAAPASHKSN